MVLELDALARARVGILRLVTIVGDERIVALLERKPRLRPGLARVGADGFRVVLDDEMDRQSVIAGVLHALVGDARLGGHFPHETEDAVRTAAALDGKGDAHGDGEHPAHDGRGDDAVCGEAEGDGAAGHYLPLQFLRRHALEKALVMAAPRTQDPILRAHPSEKFDDLVFIAEIEVNGRGNLRRVEFVRDVGLESDQLVLGHGRARTGSSDNFRQFTETAQGLAGAAAFLRGVILLDIVEDDLAAGKLERKGNMDEVIQLFADLQTTRGRHKKQEEPASARAGELAAQGARRQRAFVDFLHRGVGHLGTEAALQLPVHAHQPPEFLDVPPAVQDRHGVIHQGAHLQKLFLAGAEIVHECRGDIGSRPLYAGVKKHEARGQRAQPFGGEDHRLHRKLPAPRKADLVEPAIRRLHLVLRADRFLQALLLYMDGLRRELVLAGHPRLERAQGVQYADRERRAGPHAAAGGQVAIVVNLDAAMDFQETQRLADGGMLNFVQTIAVLDLRINDADAVFKKRREMAHGEVAILVNRRGQDGAAVFAVPGRVVRSSAKEGNPEGGSADDHVKKQGKNRYVLPLGPWCANVNNSPPPWSASPGGREADIAQRKRAPPIERGENPAKQRLLTGVIVIHYFRVPLQRLDLEVISARPHLDERV